MGIDIFTYIFNLFVGFDGYDALKSLVLLSASGFVVFCWS